ncbi:LPXTG cell wall anchor domain-containing protein [Arenibacter aquaticus]|uniref:LPXTG cell wall anchor domain-containing protein n=1 Tax=Arenibacter aquaticus TaxID=2489054 RepID=A0A3S0ADU4_9FLAO|nr:LPXTG cell wall anchor domain-containing protein [Arenibacter aquaticus]RTE53256.1 LPXTG cell wall anchor domain-containing protein [Arenibacter aquaticus]
MSQDLRKMFENIDLEVGHSMKKDHEERFLKRLNKELPKTGRRSYKWYMAAALIVALIGLGIMIVIKTNTPKAVESVVVDKGRSEPEKIGISLGDLSPNLKKVEDYYIANINLELSQLQISDSNKALIDSFLEQLEALNLEYKKLNRELNDIGPNDQTISALIKNLQLRLELLHKLRNRLKELQNTNSAIDGSKQITSI